MHIRKFQESSAPPLGRRHLVQLPRQRYICRSKYGCFCLSPKVTYLHTKIEGGSKNFISNFASLSWRIALKGFLAEKLSAETSIPNICMITDGKKASQQICQYVDTLMSTYNPCPPDSEIWIKPKIHPCKQRHECVADIDDDYTNLLNTVQRHTRCNTRYCLRYKQGVKDMQCRFNCPFDLCPGFLLEAGSRVPAPVYFELSTRLLKV